MLDGFNSTCRRCFDAVFFPFADRDVWLAIAVWSLATGLAMLVAYRLASNQERILAVKDKIIAHLLEMRLYGGSLPITCRALANLIRYNLLYMIHSLRPMLMMIVPLVLAIIHIDQWLGYRALRPGEAATVKVLLKDGCAPTQQIVSLEPARGYVVESPAVRIDRDGEMDWRVRAAEPGAWDMTLMINKDPLNKRLVVGEKSLSRISVARFSQNWLDQLTNPGESALPQSSTAKMIEVAYPARRVEVFGWRMHWLVPYFVLSILFGLLFRPLFKVVV